MTIRRPGRLPNVSYVSIQRYSLTLCTFERCDCFKDSEVVTHARSLLLQFARDHQFAIPAYCFMPDHLHVLAEGLTVESTLERFMSRFKQKTGFWCSQQKRRRLWQDGYYDRILRSDEATLTVVRYILENPIRAGLAKSIQEYPHLGSDRYTLEELAEAVASQG
jgi:putative transposase